MTWFRCIGNNSGGGGGELELVYTLQAGARWETFDNPNSTEPLIVEDLLSSTSGSFPTISVKKISVNPSTLRDRSRGDVYNTIGKTFNNVDINMAKTASDNKLWISTNGNPTSGETIKVYKQTSTTT